MFYCSIQIVRFFLTFLREFHFYDILSSMMFFKCLLCKELVADVSVLLQRIIFRASNLLAGMPTEDLKAGRLCRLGLGDLLYRM